jgi:hypothetical protein
MSTKDPLEDLFRDNQHGLDEKPRDLIWDRIEERLDEKPVLKKKTKVWKYAVAACAVVGISLAGFIIINLNYSPEYPESTSSIVLETEMNEEKATEILDQLEEEKTSIATTQSHSSAPEIIESIPPEPTAKKAIESQNPVAEVYAYDAPVMAAPAPVPSAKNEEFTKDKEIYQAEKEEILVYRGTTPAKKEGNYILSNKDSDRRLGNMAEKSASYDIFVSDTLKTSRFLVRTNKSDVFYDKISNSRDSVVYINSGIAFPSKIILIQEKNDSKIIFEGDPKFKNSTQSLEIQKYVNENKSWIFSVIEID